MKSNSDGRRGFTIVELVIVIAIIAILAAVLVPTYSTVTEKARRSNALSTARKSFAIIAVEENGELDPASYYFLTEHYVFQYSSSNGLVEAVSERLEGAAAAWQNLRERENGKTPSRYFCSPDVDQTLAGAIGESLKSSTGFSDAVITNSDISKDLIVVKYLLSDS